MKRLILLLTLTVTTQILFGACISTSTGWTYVGREELSPQQEKHLFEQSHEDCNRRFRVAQQAVKEYSMNVDPAGAYEHCMHARGWQPVGTF